MAATTIVSAVGYLVTQTLKDVENDSNSEGYSTVNVRVEPIGGIAGFLTLMVPTSALAGINPNAPCSVTISQGAGLLSSAVTA